MKTPIRYAGGKSKAYNIITEYLPKLPYPERIICLLYTSDAADD